MVSRLLAGRIFSVGPPAFRDVSLPHAGMGGLPVSERGKLEILGNLVKYSGLSVV